MADSALFLLPILFPMVSALGCFVLGKCKKLAGAYALFAAAAQAILVCLVGPRLYTEGAALSLPGAFGLGLHFSMTGFQLLLCFMAALMWLGSTMAAREELVPYGRVERYHFFSFLTLGAIIGVFCAADLYTLLVFFEMMSFASWPIVCHAETKQAARAADSYLAFAVIGGLVTLMGLFMLYALTGTLRFDRLQAACPALYGNPVLYVAGALTVFGFVAKAAVWPLHTWLPAAHPVAPAPGSALLSGIITKAGVYGLAFTAAAVFGGSLAWANAQLAFGIITMVTGGVLALFSTNLKRTMACSTMSQIGFIVFGLAVQGLLQHEKAIAVAGLTLHMANHSLFKLCLFVCAGVVACHEHDLSLDSVQGFGRGKPLLMFGFGACSLGLMGVPLFNGYASKTLLHEGLVEYLHLLAHEGHSTTLYKGAEWLFLFSGGLTAAYMIKLFVCLFVHRNPSAERQDEYDSLDRRYMRPLTAAVPVLCGVAALGAGMAPNRVLLPIAHLAYGFFGSEGLHESLHFFSLENLKGSAISLSIGLLLYLLIECRLLRTKDKDGAVLHPDRWPAALNLEDRLYRPALQGLAFAGAAFARLAASLLGWAATWGDHLLHLGQGPIVHFEEDDRFGIYEAEPVGRFGFRNSLAFSLLLFCMGVIAVMAYMLGRYYWG